MPSNGFMITLFIGNVSPLAVLFKYYCFSVRRMLGGRYLVGAASFQKVPFYTSLDSIGDPNRHLHSSKQERNIIYIYIYIYIYISSSTSIMSGQIREPCVDVNDKPGFFIMLISSVGGGISCISYLNKVIGWAKQFKEPNTWNSDIALKLMLHLDLRI